MTSNCHSDFPQYLQISVCISSSSRFNSRVSFCMPLFLSFFFELYVLVPIFIFQCLNFNLTYFSFSNIQVSISSRNLKLLFIIMEQIFPSSFFLKFEFTSSISLLPIFWNFVSFPDFQSHFLSLFTFIENDRKPN